MNRNDFRRLAGIRIKDAETLLRDGCYEGQLLPVRVRDRVRIESLHRETDQTARLPGQTLLQDAYTHDLSKLLKAAKLETARDAEFDRNLEFRLNWHVVKEWREQSRYEVPSRQKAEELFNAIADRKDGVLRWIKRHW